jgi:hypothetical protein
VILLRNTEPTAETTVAVQLDGVSLTRSNAMEGKFMT